MDANTNVKIENDVDQDLELPINPENTPETNESSESQKSKDEVSISEATLPENLNIEIPVNEITNNLDKSPITSTNKSETVIGDNCSPESVRNSEAYICCNEEPVSITNKDEEYDKETGQYNPNQQNSPNSIYKSCTVDVPFEEEMDTEGNVSHHLDDSIVDAVENIEDIPPICEENEHQSEILQQIPCSLGTSTEHCSSKRSFDEMETNVETEITSLPSQSLTINPTPDLPYSTALSKLSSYISSDEETDSESDSDTDETTEISSVNIKIEPQSSPVSFASIPTPNNSMYTTQVDTSIVKVEQEWQDNEGEVEFLEARDRYRQTTTLACSSSDCSDSSDSESDSSESEHKGQSSDSDDEGVTSKVADTSNVRQPKKTDGETLTDELPLIEKLQISVDEEDSQPIGVISNIIKNQVLIQSLKGIPSIDLDTVLFLDKGCKCLGKVFDVFGPVTEPMYIILMNKEDHGTDNIQIGTTVYFAPRTEHTSYLILDELMKMKGSDASFGCDNEAPAKHVEYSDDEEERAAKRLWKAKRKLRVTSTNDDDDDDDVKIISTGQTPRSNPFNRFGQRSGSNNSMQNQSMRPRLPYHRQSVNDRPYQRPNTSFGAPPRFQNSFNSMNGPPPNHNNSFNNDSMRNNGNGFRSNQHSNGFNSHYSNRSGPHPGFNNGPPPYQQPHNSGYHPRAGPPSQSFSRPPRPNGPPNFNTPPPFYQSNQHPRPPGTDYYFSPPPSR